MSSEHTIRARHANTNLLVGGNSKHRQRARFCVGAGQGSVQDRRTDAVDVEALESPLLLYAARRRIAADQLRH